MFHCMYVPHLYPFLCRRTLRLLPCLGCCKHWSGEHWGLHHRLAGARAGGCRLSRFDGGTEGWQRPAHHPSASLKPSPIHSKSRRSFPGSPPHFQGGPAPPPPREVLELPLQVARSVDSGWIGHSYAPVTSTHVHVPSWGYNVDSQQYNQALNTQKDRSLGESFHTLVFWSAKWE